MAFKLDFGIWGDIFAVPTAIVDSHIQLCGATSLKVLLVLLRHSARSLTLSELAGLVGLSEGDAQDALNYWLRTGVIKCTPQGQDQLLEPGYGPAPPGAAEAPAEAPPVPPEGGEEGASGQKLVKFTARPRLTQEQIADMARDDNQVSSLVQEAQDILGKPLSPSSTESLVSLYAYGGMPAELILMVIQYCVSNQKSSMRYIETTAYDWMDRGIDTFDKAEQYIVELTRHSENEKMIKDAFGIYARSLTAKELEYCNKWLDSYHFDLPMIKLAYERTVDSKGKISFPYCDGILAKWYEKGIKTPRQAMEERNTADRGPAGAGGAGGPRAYAAGGAAPFGEKEKYDKAHAILQQRRNAARETAAQRKEEVYGRLPRLREIDAQLAKTGFEVSKAVLMGGNTGELIARLREKNLGLQQEKERLLCGGGYPADYLETPYTCKLCEDKGYKPDGEKCDCLKGLLA